MIRRARLRRVFITNLVRCNPRDAGGRNRDPDAREIANCRIHLEVELALARPAMVVGLGRVAWREIAGRAAPFAPRAAAPICVGGRRIYPMYHPAYVIRGAYPAQAYADDFDRLAAFVRTAAPN